jgi:type IV secretory pathway protease TraF
MIKKVERIDQGTGELFVIGSHDSSVDSRHFGPIGREALVGKVIWHIRKPAA